MQNLETVFTYWARKDYNESAPIAFARLLVDITRTFFRCLSLSNCVRSAFTTCSQCQYDDEIRLRSKLTLSASEGSVPAIAPALAAVNDSTSSIHME